MEKQGKRMRKFVVETASGDFETMAVSEEKARSNIRFRMRKRLGCYPSDKYWTVKEI